MSPEVPADPFVRAETAAATIAERSGVTHHDIALVLGSGWGGAAEELGDVVAEFPAAEVPGFAPPAVAGHSAMIRSVRLAGQETDTLGPGGGLRYGLVLGSRTHFYEARDAVAVAHPVRTAAACGASRLVLTNGCGTLRADWEPGSAVLIADHLNLTGTSPLQGATFVDLTDVYAKRLRDIARDVDPSLTEGVYAQVPGPHYETPAEAAMLARLGGDMVGMSTALEAIAARHAGMEVLGLSLVTNVAPGLSPVPLAHEDVIEVGRQSAPRISRLLAEVATRL